MDFTQVEINALTDEEARRLILETKWELALAYSYPTCSLAPEGQFTPVVLAPD